MSDTPKDKRYETIEFDNHLTRKDMITLLRMWLVDHVDGCSLSIFDDYMLRFNENIADEDAEALIQTAVFETIRNDTIVTALTESLKWMEDGRHLTECVKSLSEFKADMEQAMQQAKAKKDAKSLSTYSDYHPSELMCESDGEATQ